MCKEISDNTKLNNIDSDFPLCLDKNSEYNYKNTLVIRSTI